MGASGDAGNKVSTVLGDHAIIVGDHPNTHPAIYVDPTGKETNAYGLSDTGMVESKSAMPTFRAIDNAGDFHGGNYTVTAMNGIHFASGAGGLSANISGNIALSSWGGKVTITSSTQIGTNAQVLALSATNTVKISGPSLYIDAKETTFTKNVTFGNNVKVNGGLAVNGELYASHITTMRQVKPTTVADGLPGYAIMGGLLTGTVIAAADPLMMGPLTIQLIGNGLPITTTMPHHHLYNTIASSTVNGPTELFEGMTAVEGDAPAQAKPNDIEELLDLEGTLSRIGEAVITSIMG